MERICSCYDRSSRGWPILPYTLIINNIAVFASTFLNPFRRSLSTIRLFQEVTVLDGADPNTACWLSPVCNCCAHNDKRSSFGLNASLSFYLFETLSVRLTDIFTGRHVLLTYYIIAIPHRPILNTIQHPNSFNHHDFL